MKHILLFLWLIPAGLMAQDKLADELFLSQGISNTTGSDKHAVAFISRTSGSTIDLFRKNDSYAFPGKRAFNVYPNPAISDARAVWTSEERGLAWRLYMVSSDGKPLFLRKGTTVVGTNIINFDMSNLPVGTYFLQLMIDGPSQSLNKRRNEIIRVMKVVK